MDIRINQGCLIAWIKFPWKLRSCAENEGMLLGFGSFSIISANYEEATI